jgi:hypothetical protein
MTKFLLVALVTFNVNSMAAKKCTYNYSSEGSKLGWIAYKLEDKRPVKGEFTKFLFSSFASDSVKDLLEHAAFTIDAKSVATGLKTRDNTIANFFFGKYIGGANIKGHVSKIDGDTAYVSLGMNNVTKTIKMKWSYEEDLLKLKGEIDVLDFALGDALASIAKACKAQHKGKTWSDVGLDIGVKIAKTCK